MALNPETQPTDPDPNSSDPDEDQDPGEDDEAELLGGQDGGELLAENGIELTSESDMDQEDG